MKNVKTMFMCLLSLLIMTSTYAQEKAFPKDVNLIKMTDAGVAVVGTDDALYGIDKNGKELWKNAKLRKVDKERVNILSGSELVFVRDKGMLGTNKVLNVLTGQDYTTGYIADARVIHATNQLWVSPRPNQIQVWSITNNELLYELETNAPYDLIKTFAAMQVAYTGDKSAILHLGVGQLGEYNLMTGKANWLFDWKPYKVKKPHDGKGDSPSALNSGYAIMQLDEASNTLYFPFREMLIAMDAKTGKSKWDVKANKLGKVKDMYVIDEGVLVYTYKGLQLVDKKTGMSKWEKPIKIKGDGGFLLKDGKTFYIVSKGTIQKVDVGSKTASALTSKIKFQGGESIGDIEVMGNLIVLSASQNVIGIDKNSGAIKFNTFYKPPGKGALAIIGELAANAAMQGMAMAQTAHNRQAAIHNSNSTYLAHTPAVIRSRSGGSASADTGKNMYISTKFKDGDAVGFGVAKVDKATGKTLKKVVIGDRNPIYVVDDNSGVIFFKSGKKSVSIKTVN